MAIRKCSCSSVLVAITKPTRTKRQSSKTNKHHAFCNQWAFECNYQYKVKIDCFHQENDMYYFVVPYKQQQYLVDFDRFANVSRKLTKYLHANSVFLNLYNDKSFPSRDICTVPFDYHTRTGIEIQPKALAEFVNWINGADGDYRHEDGRQAIHVGHINEYMQLFALALLYDIPALWNWCVKEVSCLPIEASKAHIAQRKYMDMGHLVHDRETYTYYPYTVPEGHYTRLPRAWTSEASSTGSSQRSPTELSQSSSAQSSQQSSTQSSQPTTGLSQPSPAEPAVTEAIPEATPRKVTVVKLSTPKPGIPKASPSKVSTPKLGTFRLGTSKANARVTKPHSRRKQLSTAPQPHRRAPSKRRSDNLEQALDNLDGISGLQAQDKDSGYGTASPEYAARMRAMMEAEEGSTGK